MAQQLTAKVLIDTKTAYNRISEVLPSNLNIKKFLMLVKCEIKKDPLLSQCDGVTMLRSVVKAASIGLYIGMGDAYLVPYKGSCQLQIGYGGMLKLLYRAGMKCIQVNVVYSNDDFKFIEGTEGKISHIRALENRGNFVCAYAIAEFNGEKIIEIMAKSEIDFIMGMSKTTRDDAPWKNFYDEMAKKTVIRRIFKKLPQENLSIETIAAIRDEDCCDCEATEKEENFKPLEYNNCSSKSESLAEII
jgi:recombination protein RecT